MHYLLLCFGHCFMGWCTFTETLPLAKLVAIGQTRKCQLTDTWRANNSQAGWGYLGLKKTIYIIWTVFATWFCYMRELD